MLAHPDRVRPISDGLSFSMPLLAILLCHELGHYFVARLHGVPASLPYFIPLPPIVGLFGTMGAVINMREITSDRRKLIDIGAAGPLAGLVVAIPVLIYGLEHSTVQPVAQGWQEGNSLLYALLKLVVKGQWLPGNGFDVNLHPTAFAGWAGLFVTMLNLLPFGQLDGGHVLTAAFGSRWSRVSLRLQGLLPLFALGVFAWVYRSAHAAEAAGLVPPGASAVMTSVDAAALWLVWWFVLRFLRRLSGGVDHPPVDEKPLPASRVALFVVVVVAMIGVFMPVPLRISFGPVDARSEARPPSASIHP
jgi:membrane-associated protease RseP (regulator of RpoE activity)